MSADYIKKITIEELYKSKRGIKALGKVFYPARARTCKNCSMLKYDIIGMCEGCYIFDSAIENEKHVPSEMCIPVKDKSEAAEDRADEIICWINKYLLRLEVTHERKNRKEISENAQKTNRKYSRNRL